MATEREKIDLGMTGYEELFMSDAQRTEIRLPRIHVIPLSDTLEYLNSYDQWKELSSDTPTPFDSFPKTFDDGGNQDAKFLS